MPSATARQFQAVASRLGFAKTRTTGSHERWNHPDGRAVTIPIHGGREIGPPLELADRLARSSEASEQKRLKEQLARMTLVSSAENTRSARLTPALVQF